MTAGLGIAVAALVAWLYLLTARGGFWRTHIRDDDKEFASPPVWPSVAVIIPARNEADVIGKSIASHFKHDYPGAAPIFLVDDQSEDGTAMVAATVAAICHADDRLKIVKGKSLPASWTGKIWAVKQGIDAAKARGKLPRYLLLTDADIAYSPGLLRRLVARAEAGELALTSLMVKLRCQSLAEKALIPAFVFFFQMLYPFRWINDRKNPAAGAAGGCMLVRTDLLERSGGIEAIHASLIDDCALGRRIKQEGPIWLGLTNNAHSLRPYPYLRDIRRMVARSAYDQLNYSHWLLAATIFGMALVYLTPPALALFASDYLRLLGAVTWGLMTLAFMPIVRFYRLSPLWAFALPVIAVLYMFFTFDSAYQYWRGKGGFWKGRVQAQQARA